MREARRGVAATLIVVAASVAAGSTSSSGSMGSVEEAPDWRAAFSWTYDVTPGGGDGDTRVRLRATWTVVNTTTPYDGRDVYHVRMTVKTPVDAGAEDARMIAVEQASLGALAAGAMARTVRSDDPACATTPGAGVEYAATPVEFSMPPLRFPIRSGDAWDVPRVGPESDRLRARVLLGETVTVRAGEFDTVPIVVSRSAFGVTFEERYWFAAAARSFVRFEQSAAGGAIGGESGGAEFRVTGELSSMSLVTGPEEPLRVAARESRSVVPERWAVVADADFPLDVSAGPVGVTFALETNGFAEHDAHAGTAAAPRRANGAPATAPEATGPVRTEWAVLSPFGGEIARGEGSTFHHAFDAPGRFAVTAQVQGLCPQNAGLGRYASAEAAVTQTREFTVPVEPGEATTVHLTDVDVAGFPLSAAVTWSFDRSGPLGRDRGRLVVTGPSGNAESFDAFDDGGVEFSLHAPGRHALSWRSSADTGSLAGLGDAPVAAGDDVRVVLTLR